MKIEAGKSYVNGRGDLLGPMDERTPGVFLDQYGRLYKPDGQQWDHVVGSTGNIVKLANPGPRSPHPTARKRTIAMSERPIEELQAGNAVRDSLIPRCDRFHAGPLWYGWAIMDAFLAGIDYSKAALDAQSSLPNRDQPMNNLTIELTLTVSLNLAMTRDEAEAAITASIKQGSPAASQLFDNLYARIADGSGRGNLYWSVKQYVERSDPSLPESTLRLEPV